jgi:peptidoglycan hydrolase CwlO-like protein
MLFNNVSSLSVQIATQKERIDMLEDKNKELNKKLDDIENRVTANVAKKVEQRWDAGLEKMMAWNPYTGNQEE